MNQREMRDHYDRGNSIGFKNGGSIEEVVDALKAGVGQWYAKVEVELDNTRYIVSGAHLEYPKVILHIEAPCPGTFSIPVTVNSKCYVCGKSYEDHDGSK